MPAPMKTMVRLGDLMLGDPPHTTGELHGWYTSWHRLWAASAALGAAWAYDAWRKKDWTMVAWGLGEAAFSVYKMRQNERAHTKFLGDILKLVGGGK
jgi:hypothetical protein